MAALILAIGLFATVGVIDAANRTTSVTRSREAAVNVARSIIEGARAINYAQLTPANAVTLLQAQPGLADGSGAAGWQVVRRGITYTLNFTTCAVDDPTDGIGTDDATFCTVGTPTNPPDASPADYKRVSVNVSWRDTGGPHVINQSGVVTASYHGPSVTSLSGPGGIYTTQTNPGFLDFSATTTNGTANVHWYVEGNDQGLATGSGSAWSFTWSLGAPTGGAPCTPPDPNNPNPANVEDGTYIVKASAFDGGGLSGDSRAVTVQINRCPPAAPTGFEGGEAKLWPGVELQWDDSPEEDVVGYYVYTSNSASGPWTAVAPYLSPDPSQPSCAGLVRTSNCVHQDTNQTIYYAVRAVDKDPSGNLRTGDMTPALLVDPNNSPPKVPKQVGPNNSGPFSIQWNPPAGGADFYWVYRDNLSGRPDRYDSVAQPSGTVVWTDPDPAGVAHTYWVTSVDSSLAESTPTSKEMVTCDAAGVCS